MQFSCDATFHHASLPWWIQCSNSNVTFFPVVKNFLKWNGISYFWHRMLSHNLCTHAHTINCTLHSLRLTEYDTHQTCYWCIQTGPLDQITIQWTPSLRVINNWSMQDHTARADGLYTRRYQLRCHQLASRRIWPHLTWLHVTSQYSVTNSWATVLEKLVNLFDVYCIVKRYVLVNE